MNKLATASLALLAAGALSIVGTTAANASPLSTTGSLSKGSTSISMTIINTTATPLTLGQVSVTGHWQQRPETVLQPGAVETLTMYSNSIEGAQMTVNYSFGDGGTVDFDSEVPIASSDSATAAVYGSHHTVTTLAGSGYHVDDTYLINN